MVNPGDWGAYLSFMRDNTLDFGVIYQDAMLQPQPPRLLDQVKQTLRLKHFSLKTEKSYVHYIREFILFHNKQHPREMEWLRSEPIYRIWQLKRTWQRLPKPLPSAPCCFCIVTWLTTMQSAIASLQPPDER